MDVNNIFAFTKANQKKITNEFRLKRTMSNYNTLIFASGFNRMSIVHCKNLITQLVSIAKRMFGNPFRTERSWSIVLACQSFENNFAESITNWAKGMIITRYKQRFIIDVEFVSHNEFILKVKEITKDEE